MNIKITYNWLLEYLETDADVYELQKYLTLCGPSVERIDEVEDLTAKNKKDYIMDIEITTNRIDTASVFGIAQEAQAILTQFGKKASLKQNPYTDLVFNKLSIPSNLEKPVTFIIQDKDVCTRATAILLSNVQIGASAEIIRKRLEWCDIRSINNVVDISNYLMLSLGQPTHTFDYDKLRTKNLIIRKSKMGETVKTLDEKIFKLNGEEIVIEDEKNHLTDLAGIMGGFDSAIDSNTKNVLLYVQTYNKRLIRKTSMQLGQRSMAATFFEKGLDEERVEPALVYGVQLLQTYAHGRIGSSITDEYTPDKKEKTISIYMTDVNRIIGIELKEDEVIKILINLGFIVEEIDTDFDNYLKVTVPCFRYSDIDIKEDIIEEIARVYGYHNLPYAIQPPAYVKQPVEIKHMLDVTSKIKYFLKHIGLNEQYHYSMVSEELLSKLDYNPKAHLRLTETISEDIRFLRRSLLPSIVKSLKENEGKRDILSFFEIARVYLSQNNELPFEPTKIAIGTNEGFFELKGTISALFQELHIENLELKNGSHHLFTRGAQADIVINGELVGSFGKLKKKYAESFEFKKDVYLAELDMAIIVKYFRTLGNYVGLNSYSVIKLDWTFKKPSNMMFGDIQKLALRSSNFIEKIEFISTFEESMSIRFYFSALDRNMTEEEAKKELEKIQKNIMS
ncbi:MAG: phenylalanine--tRNA ligase subunit beta [Candidatus Roizmanbacteria bacterium]